MEYAKTERNITELSVLATYTNHQKFYTRISTSSSQQTHHTKTLSVCFVAIGMSQLTNTHTAARIVALISTPTTSSGTSAGMMDGMVMDRTKTSKMMMRDHTMSSVGGTNASASYGNALLPADNDNAEVSKWMLGRLMRTQQQNPLKTIFAYTTIYLTRLMRSGCHTQK
jgi:hypothetical protein